MNQPSKKFRSRYIGPYKIIEKISSYAFKLDLPSNMEVHPVFHISLLKEFNSLSPKTEVLDNIPSSNDMIYGDATFFVHSIIHHKIAPHPSTYAKGQHFYSRNFSIEEDLLVIDHVVHNS